MSTDLKVAKTPEEIGKAMMDFAMSFHSPMPKRIVCSSIEEMYEEEEEEDYGVDFSTGRGSV